MRPPIPAYLGHPQLHRPPARRRIWLVVLVGVLVAGLLVAVVLRERNSGTGTPFAVQPYAPQVQRNFEVVGNASGPLSDEAVDLIAKHNSYEFLPKFADGYNIQQHFADARRLVAASKKYGTDLKVFDYFSSSYWFINNNVGWRPYSSGFSTSWFMHDTSGKAIPFVGASAGGGRERATTGYLIDLSNPDYRAWALATLSAWMRAAPLGGISFDSSNPMQPTIRAKTLGGGEDTFGGLVCGDTAADPGAGCSRMSAWNAGLADLLSRATKMINGMGGEVRYNGISATDLRGESRNVGLLQYTNMASNEAFCLGISVNQTTRLNFTSISEDADLMREIAAQGKSVTQVTSAYGTSERQKYGDYCVAGFLIGWQPGHSFYCFHDGYGAVPQEPYPLVPEQNLALGDPLTTGYQQSGDALNRRFQNGWVAVNQGTGTVSVTVPQNVRAFADGKAGATYQAGQHVQLGPHSAILALNVAFLEPDVAAK